MVRIVSSFGGGTLKTLGEILQKRMQYMRETARDSIAATAIDVLKSVRAATRVAKPSSIKVQVEREGGLYPSITSRGKNRALCLRVVGTNARYEGPERLVECQRQPLKAQRVYRFVDVHSRKRASYFIVAPTAGSAKKKAQSIARRRGMRYAGLAKRALGVLMFRTNTKTVNDGVFDPLVENKASQVTDKAELVQQRGDGGTYSLVLSDNLRYALDAVKGGRSNVETAFKKAANKVVSVINRKISGGRFLEAEKLDTPFPEVRQRRRG